MSAYNDLCMAMDSHGVQRRALRRPEFYGPIAATRFFTYNGLALGDESKIRFGDVAMPSEFWRVIMDPVVLGYSDDLERVRLLWATLRRGVEVHGTSGQLTAHVVELYDLARKVDGFMQDEATEPYSWAECCEIVRLVPDGFLLRDLVVERGVPLAQLRELGRLPASMLCDLYPRDLERIYASMGARR